MKAMSGHSKWSKVKHQKATTDAAKSSAFTRATRGIMLAVREGGGITDPINNFRLRLAIEKARHVNMPKDTIERAIERAKGEGGQTFVSELYEAYGPHGVALLIEVATDNKFRAVSFITHSIERAGGSMASPGAVSYLFRRSCILILDKQSTSLDGMMIIALEAGADDVIEKDDVFELYTSPDTLMGVKRHLEERNICPQTIVLIMKPITVLSLDPDTYAHIQTLTDELEALDDVQNVFSNAG